MSESFRHVHTKKGDIPVKSRWNQWTPAQLEARMDLLIDQAGRAGLSLGWMAEARAVLAELKSRRLKASVG